MDSPTDRLIAFINRWYAVSYSDADGSPEADIRRTEDRLGVRFPTQLFDFYRAFGDRAGRDNQVDIGAWIPGLDVLGPQHIVSGRLVFAVEDGAGYTFVVNVEDPDATDPPVLFSGYMHESGGFRPVGASLSAFLEVLAVVQTVQGAVWELGGPFGALRTGLFSGRAFSQSPGEIPLPGPEESREFARMFRVDLHDDRVLCRDFLWTQYALVMATKGDAERAVVKRVSDTGAAWEVASSDPNRDRT